MSRKSHKLLAVGIGALLLLLSASLGGYFLRHGMSQVQAYEKGQPTLPLHVLVASQGSVFKDRLVSAIVARLEQRPAHVKVIDVGALGGIHEADWQAIVIIHTWQFGKPPRIVSDFVAQLSDPGKVIGITTSGSGREKLPGVDVISSASVIDDVPGMAAQISTQLDARLATSR